MQNKILFHDLWTREYRDYGQRNSTGDEFSLYLKLLQEYSPLPGDETTLEDIDEMIRETL